MILHSPAWLLALLPVAAAAVWACLRPVRRETVVGSLALWQSVAQDFDFGGAAARRKIPPGWTLLLTGAVFAVLALARPMWLPVGGERSGGFSPSAGPSVSFDALAGEVRPDGRAEVFVRLRNHRDFPFQGSLCLEPGRAVLPLTVPPRETWQGVRTVSAAPSLTVRVENAAGEPVAAERLHSLRPGATRLAVLGRAGPLVYRYLQAEERIRLVGDLAEADAVLAQEVDPPPGVPALVFAPPRPPPGWRTAVPRFAVALEASDIAADDPVMRDVNAAAMAIRRAKPWREGDAVAGKMLLRRDDEAWIVRTVPEADASGRTPRRVYVAFSLAEDNTNFKEIPSPFLTLLANAVRWLHPAEAAREVYCRESAPSGVFFSPSPGAAAMAKKDISRGVELSRWCLAAAMLCWILGWRSERKAAEHGQGTA